jgi:2-keto-3-deoxy-galactonokinase
MDVRNLSHDKLLSLAVQSGVLSDYRNGPTRISLYRQEELVFEGDPEEARLFLMGLVLGYDLVSTKPGKGDATSLADDASGPLITA